MAAVVLASALFAGAGALMKASGGRGAWSVVAVVVLFGVGAIVMRGAVHRQGLAHAWLLGLGVEAVASTLLGMWLYSERFSSTQLAGLVLVVGGTALLRVA